MSDDDIENVAPPEPEQDVGLPQPALENRSSVFEDVQIDNGSISDIRLSIEDSTKSRVRYFFSV